MEILKTEIVMKRLFLIAISLIMISSIAEVKAQRRPLSNLITEGLRYNEGLVVYKDMVLVSNFGTNECDPLNQEGKGYIMSVSGNNVKMFISTDGYMSAPKGMAVHNHHLFIADVGKVLVYNLKKLNVEKPKVIEFPEGELFVNDVAVLGDLVLVTVTNTGNIYALDATDLNLIGSPSLIGNVPGANGLVINNGYVYCASYNPDGVPNAQNVIYYADMLAGSGNLEIKPLIEGLTPGQYDGVALTEDGKTLYFSSWTGSQNGGVIYRYDLDGQTPLRTIDYGVNFGGPADICIYNSMLYIPDLVGSAIYRFSL